MELIKLYALRCQGDKLYKNSITALSKMTEMNIKIASILNVEREG